RQPREPLRPTLAARILRDPDEGHARRCLAALVGLDADDGPESPTARAVPAQVLTTRAEPALLADASAIPGEPDAAITLFERADLGAHTRGRALATMAEVAPDRAAALARDLITRVVEARGRGPDRPLLPACLDVLLEAGDPAAVDLVGRVLDV